MKQIRTDTASPRFSAVRASFLSALVVRLESMGCCAQPVLNKTGISPAQLTDPYGAIPLPQFVAFLEGTAEAVGDPVLGARIGADLKAGDMGPVGIVLSLSESVQTGIARFVRYTNALQGGTESQWIRADRNWIFSYRLTDDAIWPRRQDAEFSLVSLAQVVRDNFTSRWKPVEVHFEHPAPGNPALLKRFFQCPVRFLQPINRLILAEEDCAAIVRKEDRNLLAVLERHVGDLIGAAPPVEDMQQAARAVIDSNLGLSPVRLNHVAMALGVAPRTLQRHLAGHGTSLRLILEQIRRERALRMLAQPGAKVAHVADALGYTDPTAFWRAWRGWTGDAPSRTRKPRP